MSQAKFGIRGAVLDSTSEEADYCRVSEGERGIPVLDLLEQAVGISGSALDGVQRVYVLAALHLQNVARPQR